MKDYIDLSVRDRDKEIEEDAMFQVTEKAGNMIKEFLEKQQGPRAIRILTQPG